MKISIQLAAHIKGDAQRRGLVAEITQATGVERHTVTALLHNRAKQISLDSLARISDYLVKHHHADPASLPGALLARDPERFWEIIAESQQLDFCLGARRSREWLGSEYVMATDSLLQGTILSGSAEFARVHYRNPQQLKLARKGTTSRSHPHFHLVAAPGLNATAKNPGAEWPNICSRAREVYDFCKDNKRSVLLALGSIKVNPVMELMLARLFGTEPFVSQDTVPDPASRSCPVMFRFRKTDPKPPSLCGGMRLAADTPASQPGIYYETAKKKWEFCPWAKESSDAAFVFYAFRRTIAQADIACGGFSSRATRCLTDNLERIVSQCGAPQFVSDELQVGLYIIRFSFDPANKDYDIYRDDRDFKTEVIPVPEEVVRRRLNGKRD